jgi:hypothetical protein
VFNVECCSRNKIGGSESKGCADRMVLVVQEQKLRVEPEASG